MKFLKKLLCCLMAATIGLALFTSPQKVDAADYNLASNVQDGVILHCFDWKYTDIIAELPNIAAAGFTSIQTSPAQAAAGSGSWYWLYQPLGFSVQTNGLGTKEQLQTLCAEAHKYGIKVIVDVVANHLAGDHSNIQSDLKDSKYWHNSGLNSNNGNVNWSDRKQVTTCDIGMADLNSENSYVQQVVKKYVAELKNLGVDGIRWDAAKHIGLPSEGCSFWSNVIDSSMYNYGEILSGPAGGDKNSTNTALMKEYTKYMTVTDSDYGTNLRNAFYNGTVPSDYANWGYVGVANNKMIYWAETHDTWSNGNSDDNKYTQNQIDRAYAIAASRNQVTALYFSRPSTKARDGIKIGAKGSTHFTSLEVAAVNHFHNAVIGENEYYVHEENNKSGAVCGVCRKSGAVVVLGSGGNKSVTLANGGGTTTPGTYYDEITGNKWVVTATTMTGTVGSSGIAVFYKGVTPATKEPETTVAETKAPVQTTVPTTVAPTTEAATKATVAQTEAVTETVVEETTVIITEEATEEETEETTEEVTETSAETETATEKITEKEIETTTETAETSVEETTEVAKQEKNTISGLKIALIISTVIGVISAIAGAWYAVSKRKHK